MSGYTGILLISSVVCSTARAVFSKKLGTVNGGKFGFYATQTILFAVSATVIFCLNFKSIGRPSKNAVIAAAAYGIFTVLSQWMYTAALTKAPISVCAMVYSFGFIIPTVFGTVVWHERVNVIKIVSILLCICTIVLTSLKNDPKPHNTRGVPISLIIAMLSSGGLGVVQKLQQKSNAENETGIFLLMAFAIATALSLTALLTRCKQSGKRLGFDPHLCFAIAIVGTSMAVANTANTMLAGILPSAVAFPIVNIGVILASLAISALLFGEKISKRQIAAFVIGVTAIFMFNLKL